MRKVDSKSFAVCTKGLSTQKRTFIVEKKRNIRSVIINNKYVLFQKNKNKHTKHETLTNSEINSIHAQVAKNINAFIVRNGLVVKEIKQKNSSSYTNRKKYKSIKDGDKFYCIDISHCFWRIAFLNTYITEKLYKKVLKLPDFKLFRNMSLALIVAPKSREYWIRGVKALEITEDKTLHRIIYDNIRFTAYNLMGTLQKEVKEHCIAFRTDGFMVDGEKGLEMAKKLISEHNFEYTITECTKIDEISYNYGDKKVKKM